MLSLLSEPTIAAAAEAAGVGEVTAHRWLKEPAFSDAYAAMRRDVMRQALVKLQALAGRAIDVLAELMDSATAREASRLTAARVILETSLKVAELMDLEQRLAALEATLAERPGRAS